MELPGRAIRFNPPLSIFAACVAAVAAVFIVISRTAVVDQHPDLLWFGITFDVCITIPLCYFFFIVRPGLAKRITMLPVFGICLLSARALVPEDHHGFLFDLIALELTVIGVVLFVGVWTLRSAFAATSSEPDLLVRAERIASVLLGEGKRARAAAGEITALYLGAAGWRIEERPLGAGVSTTFHRSGGWGSIVACIVVLLVAEAIGVHLLLELWSTRVAWTVTLLELWGLIWLLGDYHGLRLRPSTITGNRVDFRLGLRWSGSTDLGNVGSVRRLTEAEAERLKARKDYVRFSMLEEPSHLVELDEAVLFCGVFGIERNVRLIGLRADSPEFVQELEGAQTLPD